MSSETIVSALFLISAVVAAGVLINSVFPIISRTTETFGSVSHSTDTQMRTDIKIINTYANTTSGATIWLKNVGSSRIPSSDLDQSDIFIGTPGDFERFSLANHYTILESANNFWDPGETLQITIMSGKIPGAGNTAYFGIVLPNGVKRDIEFTTG
ncbi:MAG TPA: flagellin [Methanoregulaceae archaeon]|nr:flagellin [Methanoregulaceae archaeon]